MHTHTYICTAIYTYTLSSYVCVNICAHDSMYMYAYMYVRVCVRIRVRVCTSRHCISGHVKREPCFEKEPPFIFCAFPHPRHKVVGSIGREPLFEKSPPSTGSFVATFRTNVRGANHLCSFRVAVAQF